MDRRNSSKAIEVRIQRLRIARRLYVASLLAYWADGLVFIGLSIGAVFKLNAGLESAIETYSPSIIAAIALATWLTDAYYERKRWEREEIRKEMREKYGYFPDE